MKKPFIVVYHARSQEGQIRTPDLQNRRMATKRIAEVLREGGTVHVLQRNRNPWFQEHGE